MIRAQPDAGYSADSGVTLVELLVVLAILSLVLVLAMPNVRGPGRSLEVRSTAHDLVAHLRQARAAAISRGGAVAVAFDVAGRSYRIGGAPTIMRLPRDLALSLTTARELTRDSSAANVLFYPDGSASGGRITLSRDNTRAAIAIDWLTGGVELEAQP